MSNINKNKQLDKMQMHTDKAYKIIEQHLPTAYVSLVQSKLSKKGIDAVSSSIIRNVKNKTNTRIDILLALVEVALENKKTIAQLEKLTA